jgi:hypothetical protein
MHGTNMTKKNISRQIIFEDKMYVVVVGDGKGEMGIKKSSTRSGIKN